MADLISSMRELIQDLVAPELKAHGAKLEGLDRDVAHLGRRLEALQKSMDLQFEGMMKNMDAFRAEMRSEFLSLKTNNQLEVMRQVTPISERVAIVEARTGTDAKRK